LEASIWLVGILPRISFDVHWQVGAVFQPASARIQFMNWSQLQITGRGILASVCWATVALVAWLLPLDPKHPGPIIMIVGLRWVAPLVAAAALYRRATVTAIYAAAAFGVLAIYLAWRSIPLEKIWPG
jgi:hypothetical protein